MAAGERTGRGIILACTESCVTIGDIFIIIAADAKKRGSRERRVSQIRRYTRRKTRVTSAAKRVQRVALRSLRTRERAPFLRALARSVTGRARYCAALIVSSEHISRR